MNQMFASCINQYTTFEHEMAAYRMMHIKSWKLTIIIKNILITNQSPPTQFIYAWKVFTTSFKSFFSNIFVIPFNCSQKHTYIFMMIIPDNDSNTSFNSHPHFWEKWTQKTRLSHTKDQRKQTPTQINIYRQTLPQFVQYQCFWILTNENHLSKLNYQY